MTSLVFQWPEILTNRWRAMNYIMVEIFSFSNDQRELPDPAGATADVEQFWFSCYFACHYDPHNRSISSWVTQLHLHAYLDKKNYVSNKQAENLRMINMNCTISLNYYIFYNLVFSQLNGVLSMSKYNVTFQM